MSITTPAPRTPATARDVSPTVTRTTPRPVLVVLASVALSVVASTAVVTVTGGSTWSATAVVTPVAPPTTTVEDDAARELDRFDQRRTEAYCPSGARPALAC